MKLKITADDFGLTKGINYAIYDACKEGIVTSVSLVINSKYMGHGLDLIKPLDVSIGLSLNITYGKALSDSDALSEFDFLKPTHEYSEVKEAIYKEFKAQIDYALSLGIRISHLTSYDLIHLNESVVNDVLHELGKLYGISTRGDHAYSDIFHGQMATMDTLFQLLSQKLDYLELIVMPGFLDGHLLNISKYREMRMVEHSVLTSDFTKHLIKEKNIELIK